MALHLKKKFFSRLVEKKLGLLIGVTSIVYIFLLFSANSEPIKLYGSLTQGGLVRGKTAFDAKVFFDNQKLNLSSEGWFVFGLGRSHPISSKLKLIFADGKIEIYKFNIKQRKWLTQRIDGLPNKMVNPPNNTLKRIKNEAEEIKIARNSFLDRDWFKDSFSWPLKGKVTGVYGTKRILNGLPRQPHYGVDIAAPEGRIVVSANSGLVRLAKLNLYYTGGTIIIDHGHGVTSTYLHLSQLSVVKGEIVNKGQKIGLVGNTGRSTGPHLDWRINWYDKRIDPLLVVDN
tara:strand:- start:315 stop:1175 length:861 start_codon:yes stop_codon:yes gene_type:complete